MNALTATNRAASTFEPTLLPGPWPAPGRSPNGRQPSEGLSSGMPVEQPAEHVLTLSCPNRPGLVAAVAMHLFETGWHILDAQHHQDAPSGRLFLRLVLDAVRPDPGCLAVSLKGLSNRFSLAWTLRPHRAKRRVMILVSRFDHCLADLVYRWRAGELPMEMAAVVANHPRETFSHLDLAGVPFHHLPVTADTKAGQEEALWSLVREAGADLVVLARYMQVLSPALSERLAGRCINIHHSFLPGFKGAAPYTQAHARGVKLIGATAHYVTADLDEGPIIEQDVERVSHRDTPGDLARKGRDIERRVLARAVRYHLEDRVMLIGSRAIVFAD